MSSTFLKAIWIFWIVVAITMLAISKCSGMDFIDALALVESNYDYNAVGDDGQSLGAWQLRRSAWEDVRRIHPLVGKHRTNSLGTKNAKTQRIAAETYLSILRQRFQLAGINSPTSAQLYAAWTMGFAGFRRVGFDASRAPATTRRAQQKLTEYLKSP